ncbi:MAG: hypothetical protein QOF93_1487, partial [Verrucomicrobiota bacterium]
MAELQEASINEFKSAVRGRV